MIKFTKEAVGAKPLPFNIGVGTFFGGAGALVGGGMGLMGQFSSLSLGLAAIGGPQNIMKTIKEWGGKGKTTTTEEVAKADPLDLANAKITQRR